MFLQIKHLTRVVFSFLLILSSVVSAEELQVFTDEYVVEVSEEVTNNTASVSERLAFANNEKSNFKRLGADIKKKISKKGRLVSRQGASLRSFSQIKAFDPNDTFCEELIASNLAISCSPNFVLKTQAVPNDPSFSQLWGLSASQGIKAPAAWDVTKGSNEVIVAVIDSGVDYSHSDLKDNMWVNKLEIPGNGIDDDGNNYVDDVHGISAIDSSGDPMDQNGHGTHVAGTIGGKGNNAIGVAGINWNVKIMALKFLDKNGSGSLSNAIEAIEYMTAMKKKGLNIVASNNSWGGAGYVQSLYNAIEASLDAGIIFVAAAGNSAADNDKTPSYPASYNIPGVVSVAAIDSNQNLASFSNYGLNTVHLAAPGVSIYSTSLGNTYRTLSGTSMATPHVTGALALLRSIDQTSSNVAIISRLYETAEPLPSVVGVTYTGRKLNLERLIKNQRTTFFPPSNGSAECVYAVKEIDYQPNLMADETPIVIQADESSFLTVELPFDFPFYGTNLRKIIISPNGLIYTKNQPAGNDYLNASSAPQNSIASLHTDLTAEVDPNGVRVAYTNNEAVIYWRVKHYQGRLLGDLHVRTTLKSTGEIQTFLVSDDLVSIEHAGKATIGIRGNGSADINTYASKDASLIKNNLAISFTPSCKDPVENPTEPGVTPPSSSITAMNAYSVNAKGQYLKKVIPGRDLYFNFNGQGTGKFQLNIELDGRSCVGNSDVNLIDGIGYLTTRTNRFLKKYKHIKFQVGNVNERLPIKRNIENQRSLRNTSKSNAIFKKIVKKDCQRLLARISSPN